MTEKPLQVVIFSSVAPRNIARLIARIEQEARGARVCGVLYEQRPPKSRSQRFKMYLQKLRRPGYLRYAAERVVSAIRHRFTAAADLAMRLVHASPAFPNGHANWGLSELSAFCSARGGKLLVTPDIHSSEALEFVRGLQPELGLIYGTRILKPSLFTIPTRGSINIHKRKVPDYRGGGPVGLWEMLDGQSEIGVTVHRVEAQVDTGAVVCAATIPIDPFDNLESMALKAQVVGDDLLVQAVRDFISGTVQDIPQVGPSRLFKNPQPEQLRQYERELALRRPPFSRQAGRPSWKLLAKTVLSFFPVMFRNWSRRSRAEFPVVILFHHLISDRPHPLAVSTAHFLRQVEYLNKHYRLVSLSEAVRLLESGRVEVPTVAITFDDGYADNYLNLRAVTEACAAPVAYFVSTGNISSGEEFVEDRRHGLGGFPPCCWEQIRMLRQAGYEIGSHSRTHVNCGAADLNCLRGEIAGSSSELERQLGERPEFFSFPYGLPENIPAAAVELGLQTYSHLFSAYGGPNECGGDTRLLKRYPFTPTLWELELQIQGVLEPACARSIPVPQPATDLRRALPEQAQTNSGL